MAVAKKMRHGSHKHKDPIFRTPTNWRISMGSLFRELLQIIMLRTIRAEHDFELKPAAATQMRDHEGLAFCISFYAAVLAPCFAGESSREGGCSDQKGRTRWSFNMLAILQYV